MISRYNPEPLVSVMMIYYNSRHTLALALASLICQTYEKWECIFVDDGSTDNPMEIIEQANDKRIKYFRLNTNMGRGVARQKALELAGGDFLAILDSDDWYYPSKLEIQIELMMKEEDVVLVSSGMAIVDKENKIIGARCFPKKGHVLYSIKTFEKLGLSPVAYPPSLIRMAIAKTVSYDKSLYLSQDNDFLIKILLGNKYCILNKITYIYNENSYLTIKRVLMGHWYRRQIFKKYKVDFPIKSRINIVDSYVKTLIYRGAFAVGLGKWIIKRRSRMPTASDVEDFNKARKKVFELKEIKFNKVF